MKKIILYIQVVALVLMQAAGPVAAQPLYPVQTLVSGSVTLKGISLFAEDPFTFSALVESPELSETDPEFDQLLSHQLEYFLASLTIPQNDLWVNLSPHEADRIVPQSFGLTRLGQDLLEQDFILKQLMAEYLDPESGTGERFWKAVESYTGESGTSKTVDVSAFNKVWVVPQKAEIVETLSDDGNQINMYINHAYLKVLSEKDHTSSEIYTSGQPELSEHDKALQDLIGRHVLPAIEHEVNHGERFLKLRQAYNALIIGHWFKMRVRNGVLSDQFVDTNTVAPVRSDNEGRIDEVYSEYVTAFSESLKGKLINEYDPVTQSLETRKYIVGGARFSQEGMSESMDFAMVSDNLDTEGLKRVKIKVRLPNIKVKRDRLSNVPAVARKAFDFPGTRNKAPLVAGFGEYLDKANIYHEAADGSFMYRQFLSFDERDPYFLFSAFDKFLNDYGLDEDSLRKGLERDGIVSSEEWERYKQLRKDYDEEVLGLMRTYNLSQGAEYHGDALKAKLETGEHDGSIEGMLESQNQAKIKAREIFRKNYHFVFEIRKLQRKMIEYVANGLEAPRYANNQNYRLSDRVALRRQVAGYYTDNENFLRKAEVTSSVPVIDLIDTEGDPVDYFYNNPASMIEVYVWAAQNRAILSPALSEALEEAVTRYTDAGTEIEWNDDAYQHLTNLLAQRNDVADLLIKMYETGLDLDYQIGEVNSPTGLLGRILPELGILDGVFVEKHHFSVPYHTIYLMKVLEKANRSEDARFDDTREIYNAVRLKPNRMLRLRLGIIFHDLGKEEVFNFGALTHPYTGGNQLVPATLSEKWGLKPKYVDTVRWLVFNHQLIGARGDAAIKYQEGLKAELREVIIRLGGNSLKENDWHLLYLLTVADYFAFQPSQVSRNMNKLDSFNAYHKGISDWFYFDRSLNEEPMNAEKEREILEAKARSWAGQTAYRDTMDDEFRWEVLGILREKYNPFQINRMDISLLDSYASVYKFLSSPSGTLRDVILETIDSRNDQGPMLVFMLGMNGDRTGAFYKFTGVLSAMGFNVFDSVSAKITTPEKREIILDRLNANLLTKAAPLNGWLDQFLNFDEEDVFKLPAYVAEQVIMGRMDIDELFASPLATTEFVMVPSHRKQRAVIDFEGNMMQINAPERNGLLYIVSRILTERYGVNIKDVPALTASREVDDVFVLEYVDSRNPGAEMPDALKARIKTMFENVLIQDVITQDQVKRLASGDAFTAVFPDAAQLAVSQNINDVGGIDFSATGDVFDINTDLDFTFEMDNFLPEQFDFSTLDLEIESVNSLQSPIQFLRIVR